MNTLTKLRRRTLALLSTLCVAAPLQAQTTDPIMVSGSLGADCNSQSECLSQAMVARVYDQEMARNISGLWRYDRLFGAFYSVPSSQATALANNPWIRGADQPSALTSSASVTWGPGSQLLVRGLANSISPDTGFTILAVYQNVWDSTNTSNGISLSLFGDSGHIFSLGRSGQQWTFGRHIYGVPSTNPGSAYWQTPWDPISPHSDYWEWVYYTFLPGGKVRIDKFLPYYYGWFTAYDWQQTVLDAGYPWKGWTKGNETANPPKLTFYQPAELRSGSGLDASEHQPFLNSTLPVPGFNRLTIFHVPLNPDQMIAFQKNIIDSYWLTWGNISPCNSGLWMNARTDGPLYTPCGKAENGEPPPPTVLNPNGGVILATVAPAVPPSGLAVASASATSQTVTWQASRDPNDANGVRVDASVTQYRIVGGPSIVTVSAAAVCNANGACSYTLTGLTTNQKYTISIAAVNAYGESAPSSVVRTAVPSPRQPYTWRNAVTGGGGGFIPGIVFNQSQPGLAYVRTDIGGAYRWNPTTNRWTPLMDFIAANDFNSMGVDSLATDAVDPNRLYIAAGTYTNSWTDQNAVLLRSTDQGNTFQRTTLPFKLGGNMPGRGMGERLAIDPNRNSILFMGAPTGNGLWKSTDYGVSWSRVNSFTSVGTYILAPGSEYTDNPPGVVWVKFDKRSANAGNATQTIYVGVADLGNSVFRSTDGGTTWAPVPNQPNGFLPHKAVLASTGMLYITYSNGEGPYDGSSGAVWKFNTANGVWTKINPVPDTSLLYGFGGLSVDRQHPDTLMVAALNLWWPDVLIFRSTNGGASWTQIWDWAIYPQRTLRYAFDISAAPWLDWGSKAAVPPLPKIRLGWMIESLEIDPFNSNRMYYGTGATLFGTLDLANWDVNTPIHLTVAAAGIEETAVQALLSPPSGAPLFSRMYDVNGFRHADLNVAPTAMLPAMNSLDFAQYWPNWLVGAGSVNHTVTPIVTGVRYSEDNGVTWNSAASDPPGATGGGSIAAAASPPRFLWSDPGAGVYVSTDKGSTWTASTGIPKGAAVAADRVNALKFYGFYNGTLYWSTDGGLSFSPRAAGLPAGGKIALVAGRENHIWLTSGGGAATGLWRSMDGGATFTPIAGVDAASAVGFGMAAAGQNYPAIFVGGKIGGVLGFFRSDDSGANWVQINDPQHQYATTGSCITGDPRIYGRVYVCTNGRGIVVGDKQ